MSIMMLVLAWVGYFVLHSLLASNRCKQMVESRWPDQFHYYRLFYNVFASVSLLIPLGLTFFDPGAMVWLRPGLWRWVLDGIALLGMGGFVYSLRYYDMSIFLGLTQTQASTGLAAESLMISPLHRYVRHPWYFFGLLIIWTRDMSSAWLLACVMITLYFILGSRLEENKLIEEYGERYRQYQQQVPAIFPVPWRMLSADKVVDLNRQ